MVAAPKCKICGSAHFRATYIAQMAPIVGQAPMMAPLVGEGAKFLTRGFNAGREMEDIVDKTFTQLASQPPQTPAAQGAAGKSGPDPQELQLKAAELASDHQTEQAKMQGQM